MVSRFGSLPDIVAEIDADLRGPTEKMADVSVTSSWIIKQNTFGLSLGRIPDLVWVYKKVTRHYWNFVPTGKSYAAIAFNRNGLPVEVHGGEKTIDRFFEMMHSRAPWAVFGFTQELNKAVRADWGAFVTEVDTRRAGVAKVAGG